MGTLNIILSVVLADTHILPKKKQYVLELFWKEQRVKAPFTLRSGTCYLGRFIFGFDMFIFGFELKLRRP